MLIGTQMHVLIKVSTVL